VKIGSFGQASDLWHQDSGSYKALHQRRDVKTGEVRGVIAERKGKKLYVKADTLKELAAMIGKNPESVEKTVATWNKSSAA
jgi:hypothetical protein